MGVAGNGTLTLRQAQKLELAYKRTCTAEKRAAGRLREPSDRSGSSPSLARPQPCIADRP